MFDSEHLKFHKSWDWLMPVVYKIEQLGYFIMINKWTSIYTEDKPPKVINTIQKYSKLENTYNSVVNFIEWYNKKEWKNGNEQR
jgi:hypothetical protein